MPNPSRYLENPVPYLKDARESASRVVQLQKRLLIAQAELTAIRQIEKLGLALASIVSLVMALFFGFGWALVALHEAGWSAGVIAIAAFAFFSLIAGLIAFFLLRSLELKEEPHS
jgi:hypothetical protein